MKCANRFQVAIVVVAVIMLENSIASEFSQLSFVDPFPAPQTQGEPSQPAESIVFTESFDGMNESTAGIRNNAWIPSASPTDTIPLVHAVPAALTAGFPALSIEFWMKMTVGALPNSVGTIIHGPGWRIGMGNDGTNATMSINIVEAKQGIFYRYGFYWHHNGSRWSMASLRHHF